MRRLLTIFFFLLAGFPLIAEAKVEPTPAQDTRALHQAKAIALNAAQKKDLAGVQEYFNSLKTFAADFLQISENLSVARGNLKVERPGRLRLDYTDPRGSFMVADGRMLNYWDAEMKESSSVPIENTLANFLLRPQLDLQKDVIITALRNQKGVLEIALRDAEEPDAGMLTLVFNAEPLILRQWIVQDIQGNITRVFLEDFKRDVPLDPDLFNYRNPGFLKKRSG